MANGFIWNFPNRRKPQMVRAVWKKAFFNIFSTAQLGRIGQGFKQDRSIRKLN
jgi:hypothetical protein